MVVVAGQVSICYFLLGTSSLLGLPFEIVRCHAIFYFLANWALDYALTYSQTGFLKSVALRASALGNVFSAGVAIVVLAPSTYTLFGAYLTLLSFFHFSEFLGISLANPSTLTLDSFILDHSLAYKAAAVASWIEFFVEMWLWPELKLYRVLPMFGFCMCVLGEALRKTAMLTASKSFTHSVVATKSEHHGLITTGVYSWFRHPSYVGWFCWSIGTQLTLFNPVCMVGYAIASWRFFNDRITIEELTLINFFHEDYIDYQRKVPTGLPFIKGYLIEE